MDKSSSWALEFKNTLYSLFSYNLKKEYGTKYKNLNITQDEELEGVAVFPTVLFQQISFTEVGKTLDGQLINAIRPIFQITITFKGNRSDLENIAAYAVLFFKDKRFEVTSIVYGISNKVRSATFRVSRIVAANDRL